MEGREKPVFKKITGVFLLSFPVIIFFMFTQKFFVQGIATSGIKS